MDLNQVKKNIQGGGTYYKSLEAASRDVVLVFDNCLQFNEKGSAICDKAQALKDEWICRYQKLLGKLGLHTDNNNDKKKTVVKIKASSGAKKIKYGDVADANEKNDDADKVAKKPKVVKKPTVAAVKVSPGTKKTNDDESDDDDKIAKKPKIVKKPTAVAVKISPGTKKVSYKEEGSDEATLTAEDMLNLERLKRLCVQHDHHHEVGHDQHEKLDMLWTSHFENDEDLNAQQHKELLDTYNAVYKSLDGFSGTLKECFALLEEAYNKERALKSEVVALKDELAGAAPKKRKLSNNSNH